MSFLSKSLSKCPPNFLELCAHIIFTLRIFIVPKNFSIKNESLLRKYCKVYRRPGWSSPDEMRPLLRSETRVKFFLFHLEWSCHRVFCTKRETLLLWLFLQEVLTLISSTNFLSLGIKNLSCWAESQKLVFCHFSLASSMFCRMPINLLCMLGHST